MPVPVPRDKILPARGNYSDLEAGLSSILDGEICYAIDQDQYYQKEGESLVAVGASKAQGLLADSALQPGDNVSQLINDAGYLVNGFSNLGDLADVDDAGRVNKSILYFDETTSKWTGSDINTIITVTDGGNF